ncbi:MAG: Gx transporter family protein [Ruminococcus sp.]|nr:Gx transporter family protein [Ruminococcus sp.]
MQRQDRTARLTRLALLSALALIIFVVEMQIPSPVPIPGVKLGLANIITVYAVYHFSCGEVVLIVLTRVLLGAIFGGNPAVLPFSLTGAAFCIAGMTVLKRHIDEKDLWIASVFGAVLHNLGQTAAALIVMRTAAVVAYLPMLIFSGCIAGTFTGLAAQFMIKKFPRGIDRK